MHLIVVDSTPAQRELLSTACSEGSTRLAFVDGGDGEGADESRREGGYVGGADRLAASTATDSTAAGSGEPTALLLNCAGPHDEALARLPQIRRTIPDAVAGIALITPAQPLPALGQLIEAGLDVGARYFIADNADTDAMRELLAALREDLAAAPPDDSRQGWRRLRGAWFELRQIDEVQPLSALIAAATPQPQRAAFGIGELLLNGIEHGNLGLSYEDKKQLRLHGGWSDEIRRRAGLAGNRDKRVRVSLRRVADAISIRVRDDGCGFDWRRYLLLDSLRACDPNGRGIAMALLTSFDSIDYVGDGHELVATIADPPTVAEAAA